MKRRMSTALGVTAAVLGLGLLCAPAASAATVEPHQAASPFGSASICVTIPIGPATVNICV